MYPPASGDSGRGEIAIDPRSTLRSAVRPMARPVWAAPAREVRIWSAIGGKPVPVRWRRGRKQPDSPVAGSSCERCVGVGRPSLECRQMSTTVVVAVRVDRDRLVPRSGRLHGGFRSPRRIVPAG